MAKPKDSSEDLGKSIANDLGDPSDDDPNAGDDAGTQTGDDDGGNADSKEGKPEAKKGQDDGGDQKGKDDKPKTLTMTEEELDERIRAGSTDAVNKAVAAVNSTKDKEIDTLRKGAADREEALLREQEEARLTGLSPEDRAKMLESINIDRERRDAQRQKNEAADIYRTALIERRVTDFAKFGVSRADLEECKSEEELDAVCARKERDYWQGVAEGRIKPGEDKTPKDKKKPAGSQRKTDVGSGGSGPAPGSGDEPADSLDGFAKGLVKTGVVPTRGLTKVETK